VYTPILSWDELHLAKRISTSLQLLSALTHTSQRDHNLQCFPQVIYYTYHSCLPCISPRSPQAGRQNEITPFKQKISLRKSILILGLDYHCYENRDFLRIIMAAITTSAITAGCEELICPVRCLQALQRWSGHGGPSAPRARQALV